MPFQKIQVNHLIFAAPSLDATMRSSNSDGRSSQSSPNTTELTSGSDPASISELVVISKLIKKRTT